MRRTREGNISDEQRERAMAALAADASAMLVVELTPAIAARAQTLLRRHHLRAGDAIQLASCIHLQEELQDEATFIAFDDRLMAAAHLEGLKLV
jgi:predicted nucleic acid-binding protein